ncbi:MAG: glycosyltransferase family 2 protein [Paracoccaceae bacterium]
MKDQEADFLVVDQSFAHLFEVAVIIPCYNEAAAIGKVIADFRHYLPDAKIYVYDNNSTDDTAAVARKAGAIVRHEYRQGKGFVIRRMFADIEADIYIMVDGDDTYDASIAPNMVKLMIDQGLDLVNATRNEGGQSIYRPGHRFGNVMLSTMVALIFGQGIKDMLSGYRVFSRRFVKSFPIMSQGFEIETELTVHSLELAMPMGDVPCRITDRPAGSTSKLSTFRDGWRILVMILSLLKEEKPFAFFGGIAIALVLLSLALGLPVIMHYFDTGTVPRLPTALLAASIMLVAFMSFAMGLILQTVTRGRKEMKRLHYLASPGISAGPL